MCRRPTIAALPTAGHTGPALQAFYQLRTPCQNPVIANRCAHRCGNPYSLRTVLCRKGNTDSHVASLLGMTFYENAVSIGRGRAAAPDLFFIRKRGGLAATSSKYFLHAERLLLQLSHQSDMQLVRLLLRFPQNDGAFCGIPSHDFTPRRK